MINGVRVAIYARLSKEDSKKESEESESIQNQKTMLINYAIQQEWEIVGIYADDDSSGTDTTRKNWNKMLEECKNGNIDIVLCKAQSRFCRTIEDVEEYIHGKFPEWGVRFVGVLDNADTNVRGNRKSRQINALVNEWFVAETSDNVRGVFIEKMKHGEYIATFPPYGYKKNPKKKNHLIVDNKVAPIVKQIYDWHLEGKGAQIIARMLNERGIPNPRKYQEMQGLRKTIKYGKNEIALWNNYTVRDILHNQTYCGDVVQHRTEKASYKKDSKNIKIPRQDWIIVQDKHKAIIDRETYALVQKSFESRTRAGKHGEVHILAGKVYCHYCGSLMQRNNSKGNNEYLRCRHKYDLPKSKQCKTPNLPIKMIIEYLENRIGEMVEHTFTGKTLETKENKSDISNIENLIQEKTNEVSQLRRAKTNSYLSLSNGVITENEYSELNGDFSERINKLQKEINNLHTQTNKPSTEKKQGATAQKAIDIFHRERKVSRQLVLDLIDRVIIGDIDKKSGQTIIDIQWAFAS
jgi:DNA invertase Pin-like site-specific DNA recombinase